MSLEQCGRYYSVPYNRNSTSRMRSNTSNTKLRSNNTLLRKNEIIQICMHMLVRIQDDGGYFLYQSRVELRTQDGGTHESATMLENNIEEDLGSISMGTKMSRNFKIDAYNIFWSDYREAVPKHHGTMTSSGTN